MCSVLPYHQRNLYEYDCILMKKLLLIVLCFVFCGGIHDAVATNYGELYEVEWCPCNPDDQYDARGSVVLGRTVMCPCDSMYDGYHSSLEKDLRKVQAKTEKAFEKAQNFKYYVGVDYNKWQVSTTNKHLNFKHDAFPDVGGLNIPADMAVDHQDNIGIVIGVRPIPNIGVEAFYNRAYNKNEVTQVDHKTLGAGDYHMVNTFTTRYQAFGLDFLGYMPVSDYFDFIAFVGLGQYKFDNKAHFEVRYLESGLGTVDAFTQDFSEDKLAWRLGAGFQVNLGRGLMLRTMYRYIRLQTAMLKNTQEFSVGFRFAF